MLVENRAVMKKFALILLGVCFCGLISVHTFDHGNNLDVNFSSSNIFLYYIGASPVAIISYTTPNPSQHELVISKHPSPCFLQFMHSKADTIDGGFNVTNFFLANCESAKPNMISEAVIRETKTKNIISTTNITIVPIFNVFGLSSQLWNSWNVSSMLSVMKLLPSTDVWREHRYNSCAVVGNGGSLYHSNLGKKIDAHDLVIRFDYNPIVAHAKDVGRRMDVGLIANALPRLHDCWRWNDSFVFEQPKMIAILISQENLDKLSSCHSKHKDTSFYFFNPHFGTFVNQLIIDNKQPQENETTWASTVLRGLFAAAQVCKKVTLYGFWNGKETVMYMWNPPDHKRPEVEARIVGQLKKGFRNFLEYNNPFQISEDFHLEYGEDFDLRAT